MPDKTIVYGYTKTYIGRYFIKIKHKHQRGGKLRSIIKHEMKNNKQKGESFSMKTIFNTIKTYITKVDEPKWIKAIIISVFTLSILAFLIIMFLGLNDIIYYSNFDILITLEVIITLILSFIVIASIYAKIKEEVKDYKALISKSIDEYYAFYKD